MVAQRGLDVPTLCEGARAARPASALRPGTELADRYRVLDRLGEGGWGVVYRARDLTLELDVALKLLHPEVAHDPTKVAVFRHEVRIARMVTHPNVCRLHDLVATPSSCFITMEYVAGEPLSARLARGRLARPEALRVLRDVTRGLAAAHAAGVIHRDLKPANVLVTGERAVIADFGVACEGRTLGDGPHKVVGTRGYMAPEQTTGAPIDARVDVYALGLLAVILLTGQRPPLTMTCTLAERAEATGAQATGATDAADGVPFDPAALLDGEPALAPALVALIRDCLATSPAARPRDAGAVLRRIAALAIATPGDATQS
jgi:serine/threonine protein kinase